MRGTGDVSRETLLDLTGSKLFRAIFLMLLFEKLCSPTALTKTSWGMFHVKHLPKRMKHPCYTHKKCAIIVFVEERKLFYLGFQEEKE